MLYSNVCQQWIEHVARGWLASQSPKYSTTVVSLHGTCCSTNYGTSQHLDMSRCWSLVLPPINKLHNKFVVRNITHAWTYRTTNATNEHVLRHVLFAGDQLLTNCCCNMLSNMFVLRSKAIIAPGATPCRERDLDELMQVLEMFSIIENGVTSKVIGGHMHLHMSLPYTTSGIRDVIHLYYTSAKYDVLPIAEHMRVMFIVKYMFSYFVLITNNYKGINKLFITSITRL